MIPCKNCKQPLKDDEQCYQLMLGHWTITKSAVDIEDFEPDEDVEYWHVTCPIPRCTHNKPLIPTRHEVVQSLAYKKDVVETGRQYGAKVHAKYDWKPTKYKELSVKVTYTNADDINDTWAETFAFTKCGICGVIESV